MRVDMDHDVRMRVFPDQIIFDIAGDIVRRRQRHGAIDLDIE